MSKIHPQDDVITLRPYQAEHMREPRRFDAMVWHRRAGKSLYLALRQVIRCTQGAPDFQAAYLAPTRIQAQQIIEPYLLRFCAPLGCEYNRSEQKMSFPGGQILRLYSGQSYERMRGLYLDDVVIDEAAQVPSAAWTQVIMPATTDRLGSVTFCGTPAGHMNLLYRMWKYASTQEDPDWSHSFLPYTATDIIPENEIRRMRGQMTEAEFRQEMECSFEGALRGAIYAEQMQQLIADGRISPAVKYDSSLPVFAALDLGHSNATVITVAQRAHQELRIIHAEAYVGTAFPEMVRRWREFPFPIDELILPHDARVTELGSGKTRQESIEALGMRTSIAPKQPLHDQIAQVRHALSQCWFSADATEMLQEALLSYRTEYDDVRQVHKLSPLHDWSSDWCDSLRYLIVGETKAAGGFGPRAARNLGVVA